MKKKIFMLCALCIICIFTFAACKGKADDGKISTTSTTSSSPSSSTSNLAEDLETRLSTDVSDAVSDISDMLTTEKKAS